MKALAGIAFLLIGVGSVRTAHASSASAQDAYGYCYHFYNCAGALVTEGFFSVDQCAQMGGLSVQEGSYCENVPAPDAASMFWFGECFMAFDCIGSPLGNFTDQQCKQMGGHSMGIGAGSCIEL